MEKLKQEALNILMLAKEIQQETGASFENAFKAIELGEIFKSAEAFSNAAKFDIKEYEKIKAEEAERRAQWKAEAEAAEAEAEPTAEVVKVEAVPKVAKLPTVKG